jgi:aconitate decarboxylase
MSPLTRDAAAFVANLRINDIPANALGIVSSGFCDCVAVMMAGADQPAVRILSEVHSLDAGKPAARVVMSSYSTSARDAALINGTAAHAHDFDDIGLGAHPAHPSAVLTPTILALADKLGSSGAQMCVAYVAGYEVWGEIALRDQDQYHTKGWHPTGTFGAVAAAAAAASLIGLSQDQTMAALSIAASRAGGLISNYGSMTKPMHAGLAAQAGIFAAELAQKRFTGGTQAIEHPQGLLQALSPKGQVDVNRPSQLGQRWNIIDLPLGFKQYPVCYAAHRVVDAAIELHHTIGDRLDDVKHVLVSIGEDQAKLLHIHDPQDALQGKFSAEFGVAGALIAGSLGLSEVQDDFVKRPDVRALMSRISVQIDHARDPVYKVFSPCDKVSVELTDGTVHQREVRLAKGHPLSPLPEKNLRDKFKACTDGWFEKDQMSACFDALLHLEKLSGTRDLPYSTWRPDIQNLPDAPLT